MNAPLSDPRPTKLAPCNVHASWFPPGDSKGCLTDNVLWDVWRERSSEAARYGDNWENPYGFGPDEAWLAPLSRCTASRVQEAFREDYEENTEGRGGIVSWAQLIREEVAEAFAESDPQRIREELVQVAALAVSCIEKIDARRFVEEGY